FDSLGQTVGVFDRLRVTDPAERTVKGDSHRFLISDRCRVVLFTVALISVVRYGQELALREDIRSFEHPGNLTLGCRRHTLVEDGTVDNHHASSISSSSVIGKENLIPGTP